MKLFDLLSKSISFYYANLRTNVASSMDICIPSDPFSREYNIVDVIERHAPSIRFQSETKIEATTCWCKFAENKSFVLSQFSIVKL